MRLFRKLLNEILMSYYIVKHVLVQVFNEIMTKRGIRMKRFRQHEALPFIKIWPMITSTLSCQSCLPSNNGVFTQ